MRSRSVARLAVAVGDEPPTEFRLFKPGINTTENGSFLFDETAAAEVMKAYAQWGVDLAIDLEHQMLDELPSPDPTAKDARGWCKLELRSDGSLWAVDVKWTPDGLARLSEKRQRYVSPAFAYDAATTRVTQIVNIAITAIPATHDTPALVAASRALPSRDVRKLSSGAAFNDITSAICAAVRDKFPPADGDDYDSAWIVDVFDETAVYQFDGLLYEVPYTFDGKIAALGTPIQVERAYAPVSAPAESAPPASPPPAPAAASRKKTVGAKLSGGNPMADLDKATVSAALKAVAEKDQKGALVVLQQILAGLLGASADPDASTEDAPPPVGDGGADEATESAKKEALAAASRLAMATSGVNDPAEAIVELNAQRDKERAKYELQTRTANAKAFQALGAETPFTTGLAEGKLCQRLLDEPLEDQSGRVKALLAARGGKMPTSPTLPPAAKHGDLSDRELALCTSKKIDPAVYATMKNQLTRKP